MSTILPTVGRVLYFHPCPEDRVIRLDDQPLRADIIYVHGPGSVKLHVIDHGGNHFIMPEVPLVQEGEEAPTTGYAKWMPFQVGQAAKAAPAAPVKATKVATRKR